MTTSIDLTDWVKRTGRIKVILVAKKAAFVNFWYRLIAS